MCVYTYIYIKSKYTVQNNEILKYYYNLIMRHIKFTLFSLLFIFFSFLKWTIFIKWTILLKNLVIFFPN